MPTVVRKRLVRVIISWVYSYPSTTNAIHTTAGAYNSGIFNQITQLINSGNLVATTTVCATKQEVKDFYVDDDINQYKVMYQAFINALLYINSSTPNIPSNANINRQGSGIKNVFIP
jgi:hypothetical protein